MFGESNICDYVESKMDFDIGIGSDSPIFSDSQIFSDSHIFDYDSQILEEYSPIFASNNLQSDVPMKFTINSAPKPSINMILAANSAAHIAKKNEFINDINDNISIIPLANFDEVKRMINETKKTLHESLNKESHEIKSVNYESLKSKRLWENLKKRKVEDILNEMNINNIMIKQNERINLEKLKEESIIEKNKVKFINESNIKKGSPNIKRKKYTPSLPRTSCRHEGCSNEAIRYINYMSEIIWACVNHSDSSLVLCRYANQKHSLGIEINKRLAYYKKLSFGREYNLKDALIANDLTKDGTCHHCHDKLLFDYASCCVYRWRIALIDNKIGYIHSNIIYICGFCEHNGYKYNYEKDSTIRAKRRANCPNCISHSL